MASEKFTAKEARKLAGPTVEERVDAVLEAIKVAATEKKRELKTGWEYKEDTEFWVNEAYSRTRDWLKAKKILEDLGFEVEFYYNDGSFAVDMYTVIRW